MSSSCARAAPLMASLPAAGAALPVTAGAAGSTGSDGVTHAEYSFIEAALGITPAAREAL
ncbi:MAG TPA: hypothetical protein VKQ31_04105 [Steroidobacteraceae bacterium]|nr:hypothetical protein [Steroidobacteraceae bacterium]